MGFCDKKSYGETKKRTRKRGTKSINDIEKTLNYVKVERQMREKLNQRFSVLRTMIFLLIIEKIDEHLRKKLNLQYRENRRTKYAKKNPYEPNSHITSNKMTKSQVILLLIFTTFLNPNFDFKSLYSFLL